MPGVPLEIEVCADGWLRAGQGAPAVGGVICLALHEPLK